jgi:hypothetical protein
MKPGRYTVDRPFSTGDFKYRLERLKARMDGTGPGDALLRDEGETGCLRIAVNDDPHNEQVRISYGFVMPDSAASSKKKSDENNLKIHNGDLDSYSQVHLPYEQMNELVAWWIDKGFKVN